MPTLAILAIVGVLGVLYGGWALLTFITGGDGPSPARQRFFRDGHAHAGVLLTLSLVSFRYLPETGFGEAGQWAVGLTMLTGVLAQSGGFFLHMAVSEKPLPSLGTKLTRLGAGLIGTALLALTVGLVVA